MIVGANACGKSNLLDALRLLRQVASPGGGFQEAVRSRGGITRLRCLAARNFNHGRITLVVEVVSGDQGSAWSYELTLSREPRGRHRPIVVREIVRRKNRTLLERPTSEDADDPERMTQTHLEQVYANRDFREVVSFLRSIRYLHLVPQLIRDPSLGSDRRDESYGGDFLVRIARTPAATRRRILGKITRALKDAVPQFDQLSLVQDEVGRWHLEAGYEHWRPHPARQNESDFSDGTLRLIGVLWSLLAKETGSGPVLLEEPELSLHPAVIRGLPTLLSRVRAAGGPQVLVTTHSPELLQDEGLGKHEILVLKPDRDGTEAQPLGSWPGCQEYLDAGMSPAEILQPLTAPRLPFRFPGP